MFIPYTKAQRIDESSCMFVADHDGRTADAEHRRQQQRHICVVYVLPHAPCPWFGMSAMFRAMEAKVRWLLISSGNFRGFGARSLYLRLSTCFSDAVFATNLGGTMSWGLKPCFSALESEFMTLYLYLPSHYQLVVSGGGISIKKTKSFPKTSAFLRSTNVEIVCDPSIEFIINRPW